MTCDHYKLLIDSLPLKLLKLQLHLVVIIKSISSR